MFTSSRPAETPLVSPLLSTSRSSPEGTAVEPRARGVSTLSHYTNDLTYIHDRNVNMCLYSNHIVEQCYTEEFSSIQMLENYQLMREIADIGKGFKPCSLLETSISMG